MHQQVVTVILIYAAAFRGVYVAELCGSETTIVCKIYVTGSHLLLPSGYDYAVTVFILELI